MKLKKLLAGIIASAAMLTLAGCAGGEATTTTTEAPASTTTTEATTTEAEGTAPDTTTANEAPAEKTVIRIAGMTGPTSIGMAYLMEQDELGETANDYEFSVKGAADEITPLLIKGELDMAAVPANLASVLYNKTEGKMTLLAVNTLGVLYVVDEGDSVQSAADLKGKKIYATGKGSTPEYTLRYVLSQNGIDPDTDVTIEWKSEPAEIVSAMQTDEEVIAMLPQPYVTIAQTQVEGLRTALNLDEEWTKLGAGTLVTGVIVARTDFVEANKAAVDAFLDEYKPSCEYANAEVEKTAELVEKFGIFKAAVAKKAIPFCNIKFLEGEEMKSAVSAYYEILNSFNPASIGGTTPEDSYYYAR